MLWFFFFFLDKGKETWHTKSRPDGTLAQFSLPNGDVEAAAACMLIFVNDE